MWKRQLVQVWTADRQQVREILDRIRQNPIVPTPSTLDRVELLREDSNR